MILKFEEMMLRVHLMCLLRGTIVHVLWYSSAGNSSSGVKTSSQHSNLETKKS